MMISKKAIVVSGLAIALLLLGTAVTPTRTEPASLTTAPDFGKLPLSFVPNAGQTDPAVRFEARGMGGTLFFKANEVVLSLPTEAQSPTQQDTALAPLDHLREERLAATEAAAPSTVVRLLFEEANPAPEVTGTERLPGIVNYFIGNDPAKWRTNLPTYAGIAYQQLYPGIDLYYDGAEGVLKGTYTIAPGADPTCIRWRYDGAVDVRIDETTGDLLIDLGKAGQRHTLTERAPTAWQTINGQRVPATTRYTILEDGSIGFALGSYDPTQPLTLDPVLIYSTYLGGIGNDWGRGIAVDSEGNAYVTGETTSTDFPTASPLQPAHGGIHDVFVAKLNADGSAMLYSTYLGGSGGDGGWGIAVDNEGNAYVRGVTGSTDFPTVNPLQAVYGGAYDVFIAKLNTDGSALLYSTYLGGSGEDFGHGIVVDSEGNAYVTGVTGSSDFPTANPLQATYGGEHDAFVAKLNADGSVLLYSTYLGGSGWDEGFGIAVDSEGNAYVTGVTTSTDFPTSSPLQVSNSGGYDAFVAKLNTDGSALVYSTYLGGSGLDGGRGIAVDSKGTACVTGVASPPDFPTASPLQPTYGGFYDAFVAKVNADGSALLYSTYLGGSGWDESRGIVVDSAGNVHVTGYTYSTNFPTSRPLQVSNGGDYDAFVAKLNTDGSALVYSTYLGGSDHDDGLGVAVDSKGNTYVMGQTLSTDFPTTNPLQAAYGGGYYDAFVAKIRIPSPVVESVTLTPSSPVTAETVELDVTFYERMNTFVAPAAGFGMDDPYTDYTFTPKTGSSYTNGYLDSDPTKWCGLFTFTDTMPNGTYTISIAGAEGWFGNRVVTDTSETFVLDTVAPIGSLIIEDAATYANTTSVTLTTSVTDTTSGGAQMQLSNDGVSYDLWESYASTKPWTLSSGDGLKTVYVRYKDYAGNVSDVYSNTITLDTATPTGSISINDGATYATSRSVNLMLSANDEASGVFQMRFSNDGSNWSDWESYDTSKTWTLIAGDSTKTVYVQYKDNAGNVGTYTDTIILDTASPSSSVADLPAYQSTLFFLVSWSGSDTTSGIASYDVQFRDSTGVSWEDWQASTIATSTAFAGEDGHTYYFRCRARDNAGNIEDYPGGNGDTHTTVDVTSPSGSVLVNDVAIDTTSTDVTLKSSASDTVSGVSQMSFSNDGSSYSDWEGYSASKSWTLANGDGLKTVYARYRDNAGNVSSVYTDTINLDTTVQPEYGLSINEGALFTNQITVTLTLPANPHTAQMMVSNDGGFAGAQWEPYATHKEWQITQYGAYVIPRTVYAKYKDTAGVISSVYQDDIILDVTAPSSSITNLSRIGASSAARVNALSSSTVPVAVEWEGSDDVSGVKWYDIQYKQGSAGTWTDWLTRTTQTFATFNATSGYTYYFQSRAEDHAGNWEDYPGGDGDAHIGVPGAGQYRLYLPIVMKNHTGGLQSASLKPAHMDRIRELLVSSIKYERRTNKWIATN